MVLLEVLQGTPGLLNIRALVTQLPRPFQIHPKAIAEGLDEMASLGRIHRVAIGRTWFFCQHDPAPTLATLVKNALVDGSLTAKELEAKVDAEAPGFRRLLNKAWYQRALSSQQLYECLPAKGSKAKRFSPLPDPRVPLAKVLKELRAVLPKLAGAGVTREQALALLAQELGISTVPPARAVRNNPPEGLGVGAVRRALLELSERRPAGSLLAVRELRSSVALDKASFDEAVLSLGRQGQVVLHHHDHPSSLSEEERAGLVLDEHGVYYVGVALRRTS